MKFLKIGCLGIIGLAILGGIIGAIFGGGNSQNSANVPTTNKKQVQQQSPPQYAEANIDFLLNDVKNNAAKANRDYKGKYVKIIGGTVSNIESNALYMNIRGSDPYDFIINVQCYPKNDSVKNAIINLSKGQVVTVYGQITDVGEVMGYSLSMDKIE